MQCNAWNDHRSVNIQPWVITLSSIIHNLLVAKVKNTLSETNRHNVAASQMGAVPERTAGAAVAAGSAEKPEAVCGRLTGTGWWWNCCAGSLWGTWRLGRARGRRCSWPVAWRTKGRWSAAPACICVEHTMKNSDTKWNNADRVCVCV